MSFSSTLDQFHLQIRSNKWLHYFSIFVRIILSFGFISSGIVKVMGERFAAGLSVNHPMGQYLEALHNTGFYYTFIGVAQITAGLLLLIPRTVTLGALLYFPIIFNIFMLSYAVRFEGSSLTSPLMVLACGFLILWNYDKVKYILPFNHSAAPHIVNVKPPLSNKFPFKFFLGSVVTVTAIVLFVIFGWTIAPRNSFKDCNSQFKGTKRTQAGAAFCDCIHHQGQPLNKAIKQYEQAKDDL